MKATGEGLDSSRQQIGAHLNTLLGNGELTSDDDVVWEKRMASSCDMILWGAGFHLGRRFDLSEELFGLIPISEVKIDAIQKEDVGRSCASMRPRQ